MDDLDKLAEAVRGKSESQEPQRPTRAMPLNNAPPVNVRVSGWITAAAVIIVLCFAAAVLNNVLRSSNITSPAKAARPQPAPVDWTVLDLIRASSQFDVEGVKDALSRDPDVNGINEHGDSALTAMAANLTCFDSQQIISFRKIVAMLKSRGANINQTNIIGETALFSAMGCPEATRVLLDAGANPLATNPLGKTPLFDATEPDCVDALVGAGAKINATDFEGSTALHEAARTGNLKIVESLVAHGADLKRPNNKGQTPLKVAELGFRDQVIAFLKDHGARD